jgi:prepilin-type processing-associated H-X9-DG protein
MRRGVTRADLAAVLLTGGVAAGLLVPAVGRARERAARAACEDRLAALGKAVAAYESAHGTLPKAGHWGPNGEGYGGWGLTLLPHLGEEALFRKYDHARSWWAAENQPVVRTVLPAYLCPAAPEPEMVKPLKGLGDADLKDREGAPGDYMVPRGFSDKRVAPDGQFGPVGALAWFNETPRRADITDGSATTVLVTEQAGRWAYYRFDKKQPTDAGQQYARWDGPWASYNAVWVKAGSADGSDTPGPCLVNCNNSSGLYGFHPGGVNALFADGSVRLLGKRLDYRVGYALISRAGGEVVGPDDY